MNAEINTTKSQEKKKGDMALFSCNYLFIWLFMCSLGIESLVIYDTTTRIYFIFIPYVFICYVHLLEFHGAHFILAALNTSFEPESSCLISYDFRILFHALARPRRWSGSLWRRYFECVLSVWPAGVWDWRPRCPCLVPARRVVFN